MATTTLSSKGQISIPVDLQRHFGWKAGDKFVLSVLEGQVFITRLPKGDISTVAGALRSSPKHTRVSDDAIEHAAIQAAQERDRSSRRR